MARKSVGTFEDRFLAKLEEQPEVRDSGITNERLREILGWNSDRFDSTKQSLLEQGKIERARGRGGLIKLVGTSEPEPTVKQKLKVFISYSHVDTDQKKALHSHLRPLERLELIESWSDRSIRAGDHIDESIRAQVEAADIFLLLISIDFINSEYCYQQEMTRALERHNAKEAKVVPVILRSCLWHNLPFGKLKALPEDGKAVAKFSNPDDAYSEVAKELQLLAIEFLKEKSASAAS